MGDVLGVLTGFVLVIIVGIIVSLLAKKIKVSNVLLLMIAGLVMGWISRSYEIIEIDSMAIVTIAVIALIIIVFDGSAKFEVKALDNFSFVALKLILLFIVFNVLLLPFFVTVMFFDSLTWINVLYAVIFAVIVVATDPASVFFMLKNKANRVVEFLQVEAILNTPIIVLLPFLILDVISQVMGFTVLRWEAYLTGFLNQIVIGIGSGIVIGIIFFKGMRRFYSEEISPLGVIGGALLAYILAENLGGNGVLSVAVLGVMFGNMYLSHKENLMEFSDMLSNSLEILVFMLLGFFVVLDVDMVFIIKSLSIFLLLVVARYFAVKLSLRGEEYSKKQEMFMTLNQPKGIAVAVLVFSLSFLGVPELDIVSKLLVLIMIYSLVMSTVINKFSKKFINLTVEKPL